MDVTFLAKALDHYIAWQTEDRKTLKRINALIKDIQRNGFRRG
jgi:toxin YoeB